MMFTPQENVEKPFSALGLQAEIQYRHTIPVH
jgi:hypothetical protein